MDEPLKHHRYFNVNPYWTREGYERQKLRGNRGDNWTREGLDTWGESANEGGDIEQLVYILAVVFGIIEVPTTMVYGVWRGKDGHDWRQQRVTLDCRSTTLQPQLETDFSIVDSYGDLEVR